MAKWIELFAADFGGFHKHAGRILVLLLMALLCLSTASLLWGNDPTPRREAAAGKARFADIHDKTGVFLAQTMYLLFDKGDRHVD